MRMRIRSVYQPCFTSVLTILLFVLYGDEQTLKRWELAERQRRKSARESAQYTSGPSLLSSVTRTATLVLSGRTSIGTSVGPGGTRTFKSHETVDVAREGYAVPLDDIDHTRSSGDVTLLSPSPTLFSRNTSLDAVTCTASYKDTSENPFVHPSERTRPPTPLLTPVTPTSMLPPSRTPSPSPFGDTHAQQAVQGDLVMRVSTETHTDASKQSAANRTPFVPPPRPLGLPSLPDDVPHATQLQPTSQPDLRPPPREDPEERQEVRWWHEWLCGCGEGPDRGGDNQVRIAFVTEHLLMPASHHTQAGRTNPFE